MGFVWCFCYRLVVWCTCLVCLWWVFFLVFSFCFNWLLVDTLVGNCVDVFFVCWLVYCWALCDYCILVCFDCWGWCLVLDFCGLLTLVVGCSRGYLFAVLLGLRCFPLLITWLISLFCVGLILYFLVSLDVGGLWCLLGLFGLDCMWLLVLSSLVWIGCLLYFSLCLVMLFGLLLVGCFLIRCWLIVLDWCCGFKDFY